MARAWKLTTGIIPVLWLFLAAAVQRAGGKFALVDPDYYYLLSALDLSQLQSAGMFHHPGTPAEVFGAAILRATHLVGPDASGLPVAVLRDPNAAIAIVSMGIAALIAVALAVVGIAVLAATNSVWLAIFLQASAFLAPAVTIETAGRFKAEPFLLVAGLLMIAVTVLFLRTPDVDRRRWPIWFGTVCGFGLATKFTFAAVALAPLIMLAGLRRKLQFAAATAVATVVFTLPIANNYARLAEWMYDVSSHTGIYGEGASGLVDLSSYRAGVAALFARSPMFDVIVLGGVLAAIVALVFTADRRRLWADREVRALGAVVASQIVGFALAAKHGTFYTSSRYFLGSACLLGLTLWLTLAVLRKRDVVLPRFVKPAIAGLLVMGVVFYATDTRRQILLQLQVLRTSERARLTEALRLSALEGSQFSGYARIYDLANAGQILGLYQAGMYSTARGEDLARAYPLTYLCGADCTTENWMAKIYLGLDHPQQFSGTDIAGLAGGRVVLIYGTPSTIHVVSQGR